MHVFRTITAGLLLTGLTACSSGSHSAPTRPTSPAGVDRTYCAAPIRYTSTVLQRYTTKQVEDAYCEFTAFAANTQFSLLNKPIAQWTPADTAPMKAYLTTDAGTQWDIQVRQAITDARHGKTATPAQVGISAVIQYLDPQVHGYVFGVDGPIVTDQTFTEPVAGDDTATDGKTKYLALWFTYKATAHTRYQGTKGTIVVTLNLGESLALNPANDPTKPWLLGAWTVHTKYGLFTPDKH